MGEHKITPIKASLMSPLRSIKLFEEVLGRCKTEEDKKSSEYTYGDIQKRMPFV